MANIIIPKERNSTNIIVQRSFGVNTSNAEHREAAEIIARRSEEAVNNANRTRRYY